MKKGILLAVVSAFFSFGVLNAQEEVEVKTCPGTEKTEEAPAPVEEEVTPVSEVQEAPAAE